MNELKIFQNPEFGMVRTIEIEGKIHFAGTDVAKALGYSIPSKAIQTHCRNILKWKVGVKTGVKSDGTDSIQRMEMLFIPESDLYRLIMRSQLPNAEKFSDWVCEEVLPSIRQTGSFQHRKGACRNIKKRETEIIFATLQTMLCSSLCTHNIRKHIFVQPIVQRVPELSE